MKHAPGRHHYSRAALNQVISLLGNYGRQMHRLIAILILMMAASQSVAQNCPDFYRFVDFGLIGRDGSINRGGIVLRAEGFNGDALLISTQTQCLDVRDLAKDGRGNSIPLVSQISYDPNVSTLPFNAISVAVSPDMTARAEAAAVPHRVSLADAETVQTTGPKSLCVRRSDSVNFTCQIAQPYARDAPLIVSCNGTVCEMPVLAITDALYVSASWSINDSMIADAEIVAHVDRLTAFLDPLSAGF
jgi:hypothetical protein